MDVNVIEQKNRFFEFERFESKMRARMSFTNQNGSQHEFSSNKCRFEFFYDIEK